jgi:hypothetical protein
MYDYEKKFAVRRRLHFLENNQSALLSTLFEKMLPGLDPAASGAFAPAACGPTPLAASSTSDGLQCSCARQ